MMTYLSRAVVNKVLQDSIVSCSDADNCKVSWGALGMQSQKVMPFCARCTTVWIPWVDALGGAIRQQPIVGIVSDAQMDAKWLDERYRFPVTLFAGDIVNCVSSPKAFGEADIKSSTMKLALSIPSI